MPQQHAGLATWLGRVIALFVLVVAVIAFVVALILAWHWTREPFLGMLLEPALVLSPLEGKDWARLQLDPPLVRPDHLVAVDGQAVELAADLRAILREHAVGSHQGPTEAFRPACWGGPLCLELGSGSPLGGIQDCGTFQRCHRAAPPTERAQKGRVSLGSTGIYACGEERLQILGVALDEACHFGRLSAPPELSRRAEGPVLLEEDG